MTIKSIQTLVSEAMKEIKTINADEALKNGAKLAILQNNKNDSKKKINVKSTLGLLIKFCV